MLSLDLRLLTIVQAWRVVGTAFFFRYAFNVLPGVWAFPAAFGDTSMGMTAPYLAASLISRKSLPKRAFVVWNLLGILAIVVAAVLGLAVAEPLRIRSGEISIQPMTVLPVTLFPNMNLWGEKSSGAITSKKPPSRSAVLKLIRQTATQLGKRNNLC